ncbi:hypothetical protein M422DRAFT_784583, partial [Sphaerobolus stellatus SS14]
MTQCGACNAHVISVREGLHLRPNSHDGDEDEEQRIRQDGEGSKRRQLMASLARPRHRSLDVPQHPRSTTLRCLDRRIIRDGPCCVRTPSTMAHRRASNGTGICTSNDPRFPIRL